MDRALPIVACFITAFILNYLHCEQEEILCLNIGEIVDVVAEDLKLCPRGVNLVILRHFVKCVAHYGDQHIKHGNLSDARWQNKEYPYQHSVSMLVVDLVGEVAQRQEVLMQKHADDLVVRVAVEDRVIGCSVEI